MNRPKTRLVDGGNLAGWSGLRRDAGSGRLGDGVGWSDNRMGASVCPYGKPAGRPSLRMPPLLLQSPCPGESTPPELRGWAELAISPLPDPGSDEDTAEGEVTESPPPMLLVRPREAPPPPLGRSPVPEPDSSSAFRNPAPQPPCPNMLQGGVSPLLPPYKRTSATWALMQASCGAACSVDGVSGLRERSRQVPCV